MAQLDPQWLELRSHLEWTRGFAPVFVFFPPAGNPRMGRAYLEEALKSRLSGLHTVKPEKPEEASRQVLTALLDDGAMRRLNAAVWVELLRGESDPAWQWARSETLAVLNERRDLLEREFNRPLILVLPRAFAETAARRAPDLWSKRILALFPADAVAPQPPPEITLETSFPATTPATTLAELLEWLKTIQTQRALPDPPRAFLYEFVQMPLEDGTPVAAENEWRRLWDNTPDKQRIDIWAGVAAVDAALARMDIAAAQRIATEMMQIVRAYPSSEDATQRLLSVALNKQGEVAAACGNLDEALDAYRESLEIRRRLHLRLTTGDAPQALRDLSVSLDNVGDIEQAMGRLDDALEAYRESLEISRRLQVTTGDMPQTLRDLSISLDNVGSIEQALGRLDDALNTYRESLEIRRRLQITTGDTPQTLRDLSISLERVGNVEQAMGRLDDALNAYRESLEIRRTLHARQGDLPQVLNDLRFVLKRLADIERRAGDAEAATRLEQEAAKLEARGS